MSTQVLDKHTLDTSWRAGREGGEWDEEQGIVPVFVALADSLQTQIPTPLFLYQPQLLNIKTARDRAVFT